MSVAFIFPGQGSQYAGMGKDLAENSAAARAVFEEADQVLGFSLSRLCFEGPAEDLQLTQNTQPAILTTSVAAIRAMNDVGFPAPDYVLGHSLGEYSALVAGGALSFAEPSRIVRARQLYAGSRARGNWRDGGRHGSCADGNRNCLYRGESGRGVRAREH